MELPAIVGMPEVQAIGLLLVAGFTYRISRRDGNYHILTRDYKRDRANLTIENSIVTKVTIG